MLRSLRLSFLLATLFLASSSAKVGQMPIPRQKVHITLRAVPLFNELNQLRQTGRLVYMGGWIMTSRQPDFGGWSAMLRTPNGLRLLSDAGAMLDMPLPQGNAVTGLIVELSRGCGMHWNKEMHDSDPMTRDPATGSVWVGLEKYNRIYRIDADGRVREVRRREMAKWEISYGAESMVRLRDGRFLVIAESDPVDSRRAAPFSSSMETPFCQPAAATRRGWGGRRASCRWMPQNCPMVACWSSTGSFQRANGSRRG